LLGALLFIAIGFAAIYLVATVANVEDGLVLAALLIVPAVVYLVLSGRVTELKGPAGLELKLAAAANEAVRPEPENVPVAAIPVAEMQQVAKGNLESLQQRLDAIDESQPIVLTLTLGAARYQPRPLGQYAKALSQLRAFRFVVLVDQRKHFVAYMRAEAFREMLDVPALGRAFTQLINDGNLNGLLRFPGMITKGVSPDETAKEVLREMDDQSVDAMLVVDRQGNIVGVVERAELLTRLLLSLVG
jgi:CBS domain-containing protein